MNVSLNDIEPDEREPACQGAPERENKARGDPTMIRNTATARRNPRWDNHAAMPAPRREFLLETQNAAKRLSNCELKAMDTAIRSSPIDPSPSPISYRRSHSFPDEMQIGSIAIIATIQELKNNL